MTAQRVCQRAALVFIVLVAAVPSDAAESTSDDYLGTWVGDEGPWLGSTFKISKTHVDMGYGECRNLTYKIIETFPSNERDHYLAIEVDAPPGKCRSGGAERVIYRLRRSREYDLLHYYKCPSLEDLQLLVNGKNRYCSGEAHFVRKRAAVR